MKYPELTQLKEAIAKLLLYKQPVVVAMDGPSGSGKSTLTKALCKELDAVRIDQDDFYCGGSYRHLAEMTDEQRAAYEIDWQRMRSQVLEPLLQGKNASYHPFDWDHQEETNLSSEVIELEPAPVIIIDGVFSAREELQDLVDLSVLVTLDRAVRKERIVSREGQGAKDPLNDLWDKAETYYFDHIRSPESFDLVVKR